MRSVRIFLAATTAAATLALAAPGAHAVTSGDWDGGDSSSSYNKEHDHDGDHDTDAWHEKPNGGMHTGGGALTAAKADDSSRDDKKFDPETYKDKDSSGRDHDEDPWDSGRDNDSWDEQDRPHGGMHTGGGGLAAPGVTAGGVAVLGVAAAGCYALRRRSAAGGAA
ncbi:hypothetical protein ACIQU5_17845 [Streptomyces sp. NPDC090306]|uniref:hypothetical protein n=1 Tax=Streptomyces sp. NPDC090306 TaxID=3365961 RepID=UPI0038272FC1